MVGQLPSELYVLIYSWEIARKYGYGGVTYRAL